ncbi:MAG: DNA-protecting protein DprA [Alphaproteobacteria bacterium]|nr:DNA-protecting protein DprA [Alphaproteobacteria bacterium]
MFDGTVQALAPPERRARLRLARTPRIGPMAFHAALTHFGTALAALREVPVIGDDAIAREEAALHELGGRFLVLGDPDYPALLASLPDGPPVLSIIGRPELLARPAVAVVGARDGSLAGLSLAAEFATDLAAAGFVVASGLARGVDAAAHRAALPTGTLAVLAGGLDCVYPPQNAELHAAIARDGLLLAESPLGTPPVARAFPRRNRIVSGLSAGVVVIEAGAQSGSAITARLATDQGREVFVVPGSPRDPRYAGSNALLRDGAHLARDAADVIAALDRPISIPKHAAQAVEVKTHYNCLNSSNRVLSALGSIPTTVDELVRRCQVSAAVVAEALLQLELEGRLERHRGNRVSLI